MFKSFWAAFVATSFLLAACGNSTAPEVAAPVAQEQPAPSGDLPPVMHCAPASGAQTVARAKGCDEVRS